VLDKFTLYDFIAVIIPGLFLLWALEVILKFHSLERSIPLPTSIEEFSFVLVVGYVTGTLLQGISQQMTEKILRRSWNGYPSARWLLPTDTRLSRAYKHELALAIRKTFGAALAEDAGGKESNEALLKRNHELFYLCRRSSEKLSELPQTFLAQYAFLRSLLTTFALLAAVATITLVAAVLAHPAIVVQRFVLWALLVAGNVLIYFQLKQRDEDFVQSVYDLFLVNFGKREGGQFF